MGATEKCWLCRKEENLLSCDKCDLKSCCDDHLEIHQTVGPKDKCLPFQIVYREGVGNCVLASRNIKQGETILLEKPAVWGPNLKSPPKCVNCLARWQGKTCPECHFPVCSENFETCARGDTHAQECGVLANLDIDITFTVGEAANPAMSLINVVRFLSLAVPGQRHGLYSALYPTFSFLSHSCICNAKFNVLRDRTLQLVAQTNIKAGEEITIQYITPLLGNSQRKPKIRKNWYFDCTCKRCSDPTELDTSVSGVVCQKCENILLPRPDYQLYRCQNSDCDNEVETVEIADLEQKLESRLEQCQGSNVEDLENLLKDFSKKLSEKHFLVLLLKRKMVGALKLNNTNVTREGLSRILDLCTEQLSVWDKLDPGLTVLRGRMLQYMNGPRMMLAKLDLQEGKISKQQFVMETAQALKLVKFATNCFDEYLA